MTSRVVLRLVAASGLLACAACRTTAAPRANVLLISIDSLRSDHVHANGYRRDTTPTIDRLAREGVRFAAAISPSSWTLPTHMTLLTSLPPEAHGVTSNLRALSSEALTLAEALKAGGYVTAGFVSGPYVRAIYGFAQGFDRYDESVVANGNAASLHGATSPQLTQLVTGYLDQWSQAGRTVPFFVFLHMWDVHYDYDPPPPYDTMFDPGYTGTVNARDYMHNRDLHPGMAPRDLEHVIALYDGEIRYTDEHIGRILDHLRELGILDDTIVVVTADHGDEFFEHGRRGHEPRLYDELVHIPFIIRFPRRVPAGQVVTQQVRLMDVGPTILDLAGVAQPAGFGGRDASAVDLAPWITGARPMDTFPVMEAHGTTAQYDGSGHLSSVRTNERKYIEAVDVPARSQYFDLTQDPGEHKNLLAPAVPGTEAGMLQRLRLHVQRWIAGHPPAERVSHDIELDPDQRLRLLQLGYIE